MKFIKITLVSIVILVFMLFIATFIFLKTVDINQYKLHATKYLTQKLNRKVEIDHIDFQFSFAQGVSLDLKGLRVWDHSNFSSGYFVTIESVSLHIDVMYFITQRKILLSKISIDSPKVNLIRNTHGIFNVPQFDVSKKEARPQFEYFSPKIVEAADVISDTVQRAQRKDKIAFEDIFVNSIRVTKGVFSFVDQSVTPSIMIPITQINANVTHFSLEHPFKFQLSCALWNHTKNIFLNGLMQINTDEQRVSLHAVNFKTNLAQFETDEMVASFPILKSIGLMGGMQGQVLFEINKLIAGSMGVVDLSAQGELIDGLVKLKLLEYPIENIDLRFDVTESDVNIREFFMYIFSGNVRARGRIEDYLTNQKFSFNLDLEDLGLEEIILKKNLPEDIEVRGKLCGSFEGKGEGIDLESLKKTFMMEGDVEIKEARLMNINVFKVVLDKMNFLGGFTNNIIKNLPRKYQEKIQQNNTIFENAHLDAKVEEGVLLINKGRLDAEFFLLEAQGQLDFAQNLYVTADLYFPKDLATIMINEVEELSSLLDDHKRIRIPFRPYHGPMAKFMIYPNIQDLGKKMIKSRGKQELRKLLNKAFDIEDEPSTSTEGKQEASEKSPAQKNQEPSMEDVIIENILDIIPGLFDF